MNKELLRSLPKVDDMVMKCTDFFKNDEKKDELMKVDPSFLTHSVRKVIDELRHEILEEKLNIMPSDEDIIVLVEKELIQAEDFNLKKVINGTGITLHTNLGRAPLCREAVEQMTLVASGYSNLEYDLKSGGRGERYSHFEKLVTDLTGTEAALAVNNNAAAVMLVLHALGYGKNMVISRGELVEIGGSFRIPAVMEVSGVTLREVGTTNKTRMSDYQEGINADTAALLKVHTSNFIIQGFTESVSVSELKQVSEAYDIPVIYDLGSGDLASFEEASKADVICFSGDKLLGGPQAGIICGKKKYIDKIKKDSLLRALRLDKMTIAALEATLKKYAQSKEDEIPTNVMLNLTKEELEKKYEALFQKMALRMQDRGAFRVSMIETATEVGGGSKPGVVLDDICMGFDLEEYTPGELATAFRMNEPVPVIGRIHDDMFMISLRTVDESEYDAVIDALMKLL